MTEQYTPTTEQVRLDYVMAYSEKESSQILAERDFDRWLAERDAEVAAKALSDMADELMLSHDGGRRDAGAHSKSAASSAAQKWAMQRVRARAAEYRKAVE